MSTEVVTPSPSYNLTMQEPNSIYANVQDHYGRTAQSNASSSSSNYGNIVASAFGYSKEELTAAPSESNLGLSCGNPCAIAKIREGETIIDLGSGAGFDVFQAAKKVGEAGRVIGVDMNKDMLSRAKTIKEKTNAENTSFIESRITSIPLPAATADCIISNCVINLVPHTEKQLAFNEMFRLLKPNGRVAISDILLTQDLPNELKNNIALYVGCISGASRLEDYETYLKVAGFKDILIIPDNSDLNVYKTTSENGTTEVGCCGPTTGQKNPSSSCGGGSVGNSEVDLGDVDLNHWAGSYKIYAVKAEG